MNGSANPQWEPLVSPLPREAHASRLPLAPALNVLLAASVVLVAVTLLSQNATRGFPFYRDNSIVATTVQNVKGIPQAVSQAVSQAVPRTLPLASPTNRTPTRSGVTQAPSIALSKSTLAWSPPGVADTAVTRNDIRITEWPARPLGLQTSENGSALDVPSGFVGRPVMTIAGLAGPMHFPSNGAAATCRWPACQFPAIAPSSLQNSRSLMPLPPQLSDPWAFSFASRLANQYPEVWEMLVLPTLGGWGQTLEFGRNTRFTASPYDWRLSTQTQNGLQFSTGYPLPTPLQWFGIEANGGVSMRTAGGLEVIGSTRGLQVFQYFTTPVGQVFGAITPYGPLAGGVFTSGSVTAYVATLLSDGQPKVAGTIVLQHGNLSLVYTDTTTDRAIGVRFARGPLDLSLGMSPSETQLRLSYTPPSGPTILAFWSSTRGLNLLAVGSLTFGGHSPARMQEYAAPTTLGAASNH